MNNSLTISNNQTVDFEQIPIFSYGDFLNYNTDMLANIQNHCVNYYGVMYRGNLRLINCIANDSDSLIYVSSSIINNHSGDIYPSLTARHNAFHLFEREISENFDITYSDHPWLKPVRFGVSSTKKSKIEDYPFYKMDSHELHEVAVGPIHAGIIEPGHFRFICKGEQILNLEIQLGYQHRGIEDLLLKKKNLLQRTLIAESIAGDTTIGHTTAFVNIWESLSGYSPDNEKLFVRSLALELERIAVHTGDLSAICSDIAYQLGAAVFGRLRTPIINFLQSWCGNRLGKGFIRAGENKYPFNDDLKESLTTILIDYQKDFDEMIDMLLHHTSSLSRLEKTGVLTFDQVCEIGAVGLSAKASGLERDIRASHPDSYFKKLNHRHIVKHHGDVYSRTQLRREEIRQSINYIMQMLSDVSDLGYCPKIELTPKPNSFSISLVEGWRGEICHCAITDENGELLHYKIKDPSFHNWTAMELATRQNEISDFPICNKSFNLSYCGFDL